MIRIVKNRNNRTGRSSLAPPRLTSRVMCSTTGRPVLLLVAFLVVSCSIGRVTASGDGEDEFIAYDLAISHLAGRIPEIGSDAAVAANDDPANLRSGSIQHDYECGYPCQTHCSCQEYQECKGAKTGCNSDGHAYCEECMSGMAKWCSTCSG